MADKKNKNKDIHYKHLLKYEKFLHPLIYLN